jgi:hypothetical protein
LHSAEDERPVLFLHVPIEHTSGDIELGVKVATELIVAMVDGAKQPENPSRSA